MTADLIIAGRSLGYSRKASIALAIFCPIIELLARIMEKKNE